MNCFKTKNGWNATQWNESALSADDVELTESNIDTLSAFYEQEKLKFEHDKFELISFDIYGAVLNGAEIEFKCGMCNYRVGTQHIQHKY